MLNLSEEQQKALMETVNKHIQEEAKKSLDAFDKTLDRKVSWSSPFLCVNSLSVY